ncbi:GNAT family N-acetyltransferase [Streptococcus oralis]|uniref:GNAT family N-acetyltransferase n=1 Tax=Streptococcus oralis TaxID=1303 RepID=UPI001CBD9B01|nr:GNAT family N-acetyltransferase [Streptococcus oralis]MBZ2086052.1 GNAT family N-acetyltransferase [Streptococcus oralis]MBZ2089756.1 GNAT family N-acetyltransferase [Streptococcus oralis]
MEIPITIRQATLSDLDEMLAIEEANFSSEEAVSRQSLEESIRKSAGTFLVARDENQIVGYVLGALVSGSDTQTSLILEIKRVAIHPDHRGQGLGTLLLASLKQVAVEGGVKCLRLTCSDDLLSYFEMNGFVEEEVPEALYASSSEWNLIWVNPFYQEEI